jgi:predicted phosphohydrolase
LTGWTEKIKTNWEAHISPDDLVLIAGDISWAMHVEQALPDLEWIHHLPGTKVMIRGNHDYWWTSISKIEKVLPSSIHLIQNNAFNWQDVTVAGARMWDTNEYQFRDFIEYKENVREKKLTETSDNTPEAEKIFVRDLGRLEMSLKAMSKNASKRIVMTHYPPIGADLNSSRTSQLLEKYKVDACVFGHLHNVREEALPFGEHGGVKFHLTAADYLNFMPIKLNF